MVVDVNHKEDVSILNSSLDLLIKRFQTYFKTKLKLEFVFNSNLKLGNNDNSGNISDELDTSYKDHPLIKSIITDLGGREIK